MPGVLQFVSFCKLQCAGYKTFLRKIHDGLSVSLGGGRCLFVCFCLIFSLKLRYFHKILNNLRRTPLRSYFIKL